MRGILLAMSSIALLAGGCSTSSAHGREEDGATTSATKSAAALGTPVRTGVEFSSAENKTIDLAGELIVRRCMAAKGFKYFLFGNEDGKQLQPGNHPGLGQTADEARKNGYGGDPRNTQDANYRYAQSLPQADRTRYQNTLIGTDKDRVVIRYPDGKTEDYPRNACITEAQNTIYGSADAYEKFQVNNWRLQHVPSKTIDANPSVSAAQKKWVACVKKAGYSYADQVSMRNAAIAPYERATGDTTKIRQKEIQMAVTAATCDEESRATEIRSQVMQAAINKNVQENPDALAAITQQKKVVVSNATKAVQSGG